MTRSLTIGLILILIAIGCWAQERRFRLSNTITLQPERSTLKFPGPRTAFGLTLTTDRIRR